MDIFFRLGTPILARQMTMRRETIRALEVRKNSIMAERKKSQMQTLGAHNEYGIVTNVRNAHTSKRTESL